MFKRLLQIKEVREQSAYNEVKKCESKFEEAKREVAEKEQKLIDYVDWRFHEENALYEKIMNMSVRQKELDYLKQNIAILREKDSELELEIEGAKKNRESVEAELKEAKKAHNKAVQAVEKFKEFSRLKDEELAKEAERVEELELEEFSTRSDK